MKERRNVIEFRITARQREIVQRRAKHHDDGNLSEAARRLLEYGIRHMPPDWEPK